MCYRGCGNPATFYSKKTGWRCHKVSSRCPVVKAKIGKSNSVALQGKTQTQETKDKRAESLKKAYAEGRRDPKDYAEKIREKNLEHWSKVKRVPWNKGKKGSQVAWNKGIKKEEMPHVLERDDPIYQDIRKYRNRISVRSERTYRKYEHEINPNGYVRARAGTDGAYHLDHIISVRQGFEIGLPVEAMSDKRNLKLIPWLSNIKKYDNKGMRNNSITVEVENLIEALKSEYGVIK